MLFALPISNDGDNLRALIQDMMEIIFAAYGGRMRFVRVGETVVLSHNANWPRRIIEDTIGPDLGDWDLPLDELYRIIG